MSLAYKIKPDMLFLITSTTLLCLVSITTGQTADFIIGGSNARPNEFPFMALIKVDSSFQCGGSLIKEGYVLTARHCVDGIARSRIKVYLGEHYRTRTDTYEKSSSVSSIVMHGVYDAAILKLNCQHRNNGISTISILPTTPTAGQRITAAGWGWTVNGRTSLSDILQKVTLPVVTNGQCRGDGLNVASYEFCAGFNSTYMNVCHGDSGGPLVKTSSSGRVYLIGMTVRGHYTCPSNARYAVFIKMSYLVNWISRKTENHVSACSTGGSSSDGGGCFPGDSIVQLESEKLIPLKNLQPSDRVLSMSADGSPVYSQFISFIHQNPDQESTYINIHTKNSVLKLTSNHLIFTYTSQNGQDQPGNYQYAKDIKVGDVVLVNNSSDQFSKSEVVDIILTKQTGIYAPLTTEGTIVVDGVVTSCYASLPYHSLAHFASWPYRMWKLYIDGSLDMEGIPMYFKFLQTYLLPTVLLF